MTQGTWTVPHEDDSSVEKLAEIASTLNDDERAVLVLLAKRLAMGRKAYGALNLEVDKRDWRKEASEEALDLAVYMSCSLLSAKR